MASAQVNPDTVITVKVNYEGVTRRSKMHLRDTAPQVLEEQIRNILHIPIDTDIILERYSDSAAAYVVLDAANTAVYKQLYRAAKAKSKLKLRVTVKSSEDTAVPNMLGDEGSSVLPTSAVQDSATQNRAAAAAAAAAAAENVLSKSAEQTASQTPSAEGQSAALSRVYESSLLMEAARIAESSDLRRQFQSRASGEQTWEDQKSVAAAVAPQSMADQQASVPAIECARFAICCNSCEMTTQDVHYHCSTCDDGDFDLCQACVDLGITCYGSDHWLIKRTKVGGHIITSTTERIAPKPKAKAGVPDVSADSLHDLPSFNAKAALSHLQETMAKLQMHLNMRTCNSCIKERPEQDFLHCQQCEDFDLCQDCFPKEVHSHHPSHGFAPAVAGTVMPTQVNEQLAPGRKMLHHAICDHCDKFIMGVRHKCLECPDWDYCAECITACHTTHPGHRFVPIYEHLKMSKAECPGAQSIHVGICCDGPLCTSGKGYSAYIRGVRFKCAVCADVDFCANCEANPKNTHNKTHPLIKFKTPVRHVSVTTHGERPDGQQMSVMGDLVPAQQPASNLSMHTPQTVVDTEPHNGHVAIKEEEKVTLKPIGSPAAASAASADEGQLHATFVDDHVHDGTILATNHVFEQTWHLLNNGRAPWPAGCSVKFVGGDYMGNIDSSRPARTAELNEAAGSNVCSDPVAPGQQCSFTVKLRTPPRPGKVTSYWRLTTPEGIKFGHRLWCDVNVRALEPEPEPEAVPEPAATVASGEEAELCDTKSSHMIFPKLDKESPMASVHETSSKLDQGNAASGADEDFEDCSKEDEWEGSDLDDFLTDEEYDILDASDEEFLEEQHKKLFK